MAFINCWRPYLWSYDQLRRGILLRRLLVHQNTIPKQQQNSVYSRFPGQLSHQIDHHVLNHDHEWIRQSGHHLRDDLWPAKL